MPSIDRIEEHINAIFAHSTTEGPEGVTRLTFTPEYVAACRYLIDRGMSLGLECYLDPFGNLFFELKGRNADSAPVMVASHIDSVRNGGRFDGVLGVVCGLEALEAFVEAGHVPDRAIVLAVFAEEEGVSFKCPLAGSKLFTDQLDDDAITQLRDSNNVPFLEQANEFCRVLDLPVRRIPASCFSTMLELHIEQGPLLENEGIKVGIVEAIAGSYNYCVTLTGEAGHAGTVPMSLRKDALAGAAEIVLAVEQLGVEYDSVATTGCVTCKPNATNVVPGHVTVTIDMRSDEDNKLELMHQRLSSQIDAIAASRSLVADVQVTGMSSPAKLASQLGDAVERCASQHGIETRRMSSGALHDAAMMSLCCDTMMVFVPSQRGISHNPTEWTDFEDIEPGLIALFETLKVISCKK